MMKNNLIHKLNLLNIRPKNILIENFIPGKIYRKYFEIENKSKMPIIINLKPSDKSKILLNQTLLRLEVKDKKIIELIIHDNIRYTETNYPTNPKILSINIKGELIEAKYIITLLYLPKMNKNKEILNYNILQFEPNENKNEKYIPSYYLTKYQTPLYNKNFINSRKLIIDNNINLFFKCFENNKIHLLKNQIKLLKQQNLKLVQQNKKNELNNPKNYKIKNNSLFILGNKLEDPENKYKIDNDIEKNVLKNKNAALEIENQILVERIKDLENFIKNNNYNYELKKYDLLKDKEINNDNNDNSNKFEKNLEQEDEKEDEENDIQMSKSDEDNFYQSDNMKSNIDFYDGLFFN